MVRVIMIDAKNKNIYEDFIDPNDVDYKTHSYNGYKQGIFYDVLHTGRDESLFKKNEDEDYGYIILGYPNRGDGMIMDMENNHPKYKHSVRDVLMPIEEVRKAITFFNNENEVKDVYESFRDSVRNGKCLGVF